MKTSLPPREPEAFLLSRRTALVGSMAAFLVTSSRGAEAGSGEDPELKKHMRDVMHAWDSLEPAKAAKYYAKEANLVFYDDSPLKYTGWAEYARGVPKEFAAYRSFKTTLNDDTAAHRLGSFGWGTATWRAEAVKKDGSTEVVNGRWTVLFEQRNGQWLIIHEHVSVPAA